MTKTEESSIFDDWAEVTTAHGFMDFSRAKSIVGKIIWFILIFFSLAIMGYQLFKGIRDFASHEWKTSIQETMLNNDDGIPFPSVIACNMNRLKYSKTKEYGMTLDMVRFMFMNLIPFNNYLLPEANKTTRNDFVKWRKAHNFTLDDIFEKMSPQLLDPRDLYGNESLTALNTIDYGRCLRIDVNQNSTRVGSKGGSLLIFDTQGWDYLPIIENNFILEGIAFQVTYNANAEVGKWIMMHPGTQTVVGLQLVEEGVRENDQSIFNPFALLNAEPPCIRSPKLKFMDDAIYSVSNCEIECWFLISIDLCNCTPFFHTIYKPCDIEDFFDCFGFVQDTTTFVFLSNVSKELETLRENCERNCAKPCNRKYLDTTLSQTKFPSDSQKSALDKWITNKFNYTKRTEDTIVLEIYFNTLAIKTVEMYEVMSFDNLISSSGGLIGLWAGMSFLTVFQAISYFFKFIEKSCTNRIKVS